MFRKKKRLLRLNILFPDTCSPWINKLMSYIVKPGEFQAWWRDHPRDIPIQTPLHRKRRGLRRLPNGSSWPCGGKWRRLGAVVGSARLQVSAARALPWGSVEAYVGLHLCVMRWATCIGLALYVGLNRPFYSYADRVFFFGDLDSTEIGPKYFDGLVKSSFTFAQNKSPQLQWAKLSSHVGFSVPNTPSNKMHFRLSNLVHSVI